MRTLSRPVLAFSLALASGVALPALAQTPSAGNATTAPATHETRTPPVNGTSPSQRNTVLTDRGDVRASKLIGAAVYNDRDEKVGSVDDVIMGKDNKADDVVVSVGGFLGMGNKLVAVPYYAAQARRHEERQQQQQGRHARRDQGIAEGTAGLPLYKSRLAAQLPTRPFASGLGR